MNKLKTLLPLLICLFIIGGIYLLNVQKVQADPVVNCVYAPDFADCYDHSKLNCICI